MLGIASQLEKDQELRRKVKCTTTYPAVVLVLAVLAASFMLYIYSSELRPGVRGPRWTLPLPTRIAMGVSDLLTSIFGVFIYAGAGLGLFFFLRWLKTENGQKAMDPGCRRYR
jgi:type IV pilus assembly protein PilC